MALSCPDRGGSGREQVSFAISLTKTMKISGRWRKNLTLDSKNRVPVPPPYRAVGVLEGDAEEGIASFYLGRENDPCLYLHTFSEHAAYLKDLESLLGGDSEKARTLMRVIRGSFVQVKTDSQGRLTINEVMQQMGGFKGRQVAMVQMPTRVEIWDPDTFEGLRAEAEEEGLFEHLDQLRIERESRRKSTVPDGAEGEGC